MIITNYVLPDMIVVTNAEAHQQHYVAGCVVPEDHFITDEMRDELEALFWGSVE